MPNVDLLIYIIKIAICSTALQIFYTFMFIMNADIRIHPECSPLSVAETKTFLYPWHKNNTSYIFGANKYTLLYLLHKERFSYILDTDFLVSFTQTKILYIFAASKLFVSLTQTKNCLYLCRKQTSLYIWHKEKVPTSWHKHALSNVKSNPSEREERQTDREEKVMRSKSTFCRHYLSFDFI